MTPAKDDLWFLPLGGTGEIGMNLNLYGHDGCWLMVDCGITFSAPGIAGPNNISRVQMPDPEFIAGRAGQLCALLITHAHEDHVGAVADLWPRLRCPVYCTAFCASILRRKLAEAGLLETVPVHVVMPDTSARYGVFDVQWLGVTHSTPQSQGLFIQTPVGNVFHTGDWKLDDNPVVGHNINTNQLRGIGQQNVLAMVCDSTNALVPGRSVSEGALYPNLYAHIAAARGRVVVGCFGSNIARVQTLAAVARAAGRYPALLGRSLHNYYQAAVAANIWDPDLTLIQSSHLGYLPPDEVLAIATGSQGEPRTALRKLVADSHPDLTLQAGDMLLLSSRVIPGNEVVVEGLIAQFEQKGLQVVCDDDSRRPIHASGHPASDELADMYRWIKPQIAIPVHGEVPHMQANAQVAKAACVPKQMLGTNGDLFMLAPQPGIRRAAAHVGRLARR
ncbi:MAG: ribonuclease J [Pseudomonadales bacterium]|nr:ribonuclease J [Pseudomonadales bacterium]